MELETILKAIIKIELFSKERPEGPVLPRLINVGDGSQKRAKDDLRQMTLVYHLRRLYEIEPM